ncbi:MAG: arginine--tRNA ligase [Verrucomicrobia bacterium]|nr:arginine--tRNA ligase [Verrucomicrobiota bacterium]
MLHLVLESRLREAVGNVIPDADLPAIRVRPCPDPRFGDYQTNALMGLAKARRLNPRQLAAEVIARLDVRAWCDSVEVAGAGFLNFRVSPSALATVLREVLAEGRPLVPRADPIRTVVLDFSSPNVAKPMHVGHIRSTILGDCLARTLRLLGHRVITDNHIGDWGTQFGMLLVGWKRILDRDALAADPLRELERIYREINARCDPEKEGFDPALLESARAELVKLQAGDSENLEIWREMQRLSQAQFDAIYTRLGVRFDHTLGESFYNPRLPAVVEDLRARGIARESEGAIVVFFDDHPELKDAPTIVQKRDGGFNYATTDLATLAYRVETWQPQEIIYVTDGRQQLHFKQVFEAFRRWKPDVAVTLAHVWFGSILGEDNKPLKTRAGDTVKLADLLDEAEERALQVVTEKNPDLSEAERREIARIVGIGAVKYQDLLPNRQSDYVFSWSKMLALSGNTAPYLQYAYARIRSIFRKQAEQDPENRWEPSGAVAFELTTPEELRLAKHLLNFGIVVEMVADEYRPNYLCNYLFELAGHFTGFYEACPVLKAEGRQRASRLALCEITARVLQQGLNLLGIETAERM